MNILVTNIGRRVYFVDFLVKLRRNLKIKKIFVSDNNKHVSGMNVKNTISVKTSQVNEGLQKYIKSILNIVKKNKIRLIIPCTNYDLIILSKNKKKFDLLNCNLSISRPELLKKLLNKKKMFKLCVETKYQHHKFLIRIKIEIKKIEKKNMLKKNFWTFLFGIKNY